MIDFKRFTVTSGNCSLSAVDFGNPDKPDMVVLHGTHDNALGMYPAVASLTDHYHVVGLDLRGHGQSDKPGHYSMLALVADLRALVTALNLRQPVIVAHSLGGHVATRYSGIYPDQVAALVILDGLGPPRPRQPRGAAQLAEMIQHGVEGLLHRGDRVRQMENIQEALSRFTRGNPNVDAECARLIVENGTEHHPGGGLRWSFDSNIDLIFFTYSHDETEMLAGLITCPVLLVTGERSLDFWRGLKSGLQIDEQWYQSEQQRRQQLFQQASRQVIPDAGHMLHYDQPLLVQGVVQEFLLTDCGNFP